MPPATSGGGCPKNCCCCCCCCCCGCPIIIIIGGGGATLCRFWCTIGGGGGGTRVLLLKSTSVCILAKTSLGNTFCVSHVPNSFFIDCFVFSSVCANNVKNTPATCGANTDAYGSLQFFAIESNTYKVANATRLSFAFSTTLVSMTFAIFLASVFAPSSVLAISVANIVKLVMIGLLFIFSSDNASL